MNDPRLVQSTSTSAPFSNSTLLANTTGTSGASTSELSFTSTSISTRIGDYIAQALAVSSTSSTDVPDSQSESGSSTSTTTRTIDETSTIYETSTVHDATSLSLTSATAAGASSSHNATSTHGENGSSTSTSTRTIDETRTIFETSTVRNATSPMPTAGTASALAASNGTRGLNLTSGTLCADASCAVACDELWQTWETASASFYSSYAKRHGDLTYTTTSTNIFLEASSTWITPTPLPAPYTLCDGIPRVNVTLSSSYWNSTVTSYDTYTITTIAANYTAPAPQCSVNPYLCFDVLEAYHNESVPYEPLCQLPPGYMFEQYNGTDGLALDDDYGVCNLMGGPVRLLYWPVQTVGGLCASNTSTISATPTGKGPNTVVVEGTTLTSPTM